MPWERAEKCDHNNHKEEEENETWTGRMENDHHHWVEPKPEKEEKKR